MSFKLTPSITIMFPTLNKIFRSKNNLKIQQLKIEVTNRSILEQAGININMLVKEEDKYILQEEAHIAEILGLTFKSKHNPPTNSDETATNLIYREFQEFKEHIEDQPLITFTDQIKSDNIQEDQSQGNFFVTQEDLLITFKTLNNKKSAGLDNIPNQIIKNLPDMMIAQYSKVFNNALNNKYFPENWKTARVIAICKPGKDPTDPNNYRPISLISNISKILEKLINRALIKELHTKKHTKRQPIRFSRQTLNDT